MYDSEKHTILTDKVGQLIGYGLVCKQSLRHGLKIYMDEHTKAREGMKDRGKCKEEERLNYHMWARERGKLCFNDFFHFNPTTQIESSLFVPKFLSNM